MNRRCEAYRECDEYVCLRCGYRWEVKDPDPPKCLTPSEYSQKRLNDLKRHFENEN